MSSLRFIFIAACCLTFFSVTSQIVVSNGAQISVTSGGVLHCNGGLVLNGSSAFMNDGSVTVTKNSTLSQPGNFSIFSSGSSSSGNGTYEVEQDWINNGSFTGDQSLVILYGNTEQFIASTAGIVTTFNDLQLTGTGTGINRRKTLQGVDAKTGISGQLNLTDRELFTGSNTFFVLNNNPSAIANTTTFGNEGFVSSLINGYLQRETVLATSYVFPVGSSDGTIRYRPVSLTPGNASLGSYAVRMNNYLADNDGYPIAQKESVISDANTLFYHSVARVAGPASADVLIAFDQATDGTYKGIANWSGSSSLWEALSDVNQMPFPNYASLTKSAYNFSSNEPFILTNETVNVIVPTAFTPSGNNSNDFWELVSLDESYPNNRVRVYNRWGNLLFDHDSSVDGPYSQHQWDGTFEGKALPVASYFYIIDLDPQDEDKKLTGTVSIIKK